MLPSSVVVVYMFLGMHPFLPDCQICWCRVLIVCSYNSLYFFGVSCDLSSFIHDFIYWVLSLFFLISRARGLSILLILSKNQLIVSLICSIVSLVSISLISALIFMIYLLLGLGFLSCSFSSSFRCRVRLCT